MFINFLLYYNIMEQLFYELNPWWTKEFKPNTIFRDKYLNFVNKYIDRKDIILIFGLRRVGKTTIMKQIIYSLIKNKQINKKQILYLSLDLYPFRDYSIFELINKYRKIQNLKHDEKIYVFLDEVTYKEDYHQQLKNLYDLGHTKIFATSSSASLLIDKKAYLTGRTRYLEIKPLDFQEFLKFKNQNINLEDKHLLEKQFEKYMLLGGMPEYVLTEDPSYISNLTEEILYKDIIAKNNIKNAKIIQDMFLLLCERVGKQISYNKIANILKISQDSVSRYMSYFINSFLFYEIKVNGKLNEQILFPKKIYVGDLGIRNVAVGYKDLGAIYENLVFIKIKDYNPSYIRENNIIEIDFTYDNTIIEAKYDQELKGKQKELFDKLKYKNKIIAKGMDFFL